MLHLNTVGFRNNWSATCVVLYMSKDIFEGADMPSAKQANGPDGADAPDMAEPDLNKLLSLRQLGIRRFASLASQSNRNHRLFGGQLLGQALRAASYTSADRSPHALLASFEHPAVADAPLSYSVHVGHDGGSLSSRRVVARQSGNTVLHAVASFNRPESGFEHQFSWRTRPPPPESLASLADVAAQYRTQVSEHGKARLTTYPQIEIRPIDVEQHLLLRAAEPLSRFWIRACGNMPSDPSGWASVIAYMSDYLLVNAALIPHIEEIPNEHLFVASLNHAMWFHEITDPSQWLLYETESWWAAQGRAMIRGHFFSSAGRLVASATQETMVRLRKGVQKSPTK